MKKIFIIGLLSVSASSYAAQPLDKVVQDVVNYSPVLRAKIATNMADIENVRAENMLDGPEVEFEHLWPSVTAANRWNASVSQEFAYPGVYSARTKVADAQMAASDAVCHSMALDDALSAKLLIIDIINGRRRLEFFRDIRSGLESIAELTQLSYERGNATVLDLRKMQLAMLDSDREIAAAQAELKSLEYMLQTRVNRVDFTSKEWDSYPVQSYARPSTDPSQYDAYAVGAAQTSLMAARAKSLKMEAIPTFTLGYVHAYEDRTHFNGFSVSLRLPSWSRKHKAEALRLEAEAMTSEDNFAVGSAMMDALSQYEAATKLRESLEAYGAYTGNADYLQLLRKAFDGGELTMIEYLLEVNLFKEARLDFIDQEYRYNMALARLNRYTSNDIGF